MVKDVLYGPAGEMTQMRTLSSANPYGVYHTETRTYNARLQMTRLTTTGLDMEYRYSATQNNGRITQSKDWVSGEEVTYQYDALQRLVSAVTTGPEWGNSYSYDGFGNLLAKTVTKGTAPTLSINVNAWTNRITTSGYSYDANGNATLLPTVTGMSYDVENRLTGANAEQYGYGPDNKRVWKRKADGTQEIYFCGVGGQKLGTYTPDLGSNNNFCIVAGSTNLYFGGRMIRAQGQTVMTDRLGSVRRRDDGSSLRYFAYGEEQTATGNEKDKFGRTIGI